MQNSPDFTRSHNTGNTDTPGNQKQFQTGMKKYFFYTAGNEFLESVPALSSFLPLVGWKQRCLPLNLSQTSAIIIPQTRETHTAEGKSTLLERNVKSCVTLKTRKNIEKEI